MALRINRVRAVAADDAGFSDLLAALPDGAGPCLCCRRRSPDSPALSWSPTRATMTRACFALPFARCARPHIRQINCSPIGSSSWSCATAAPTCPTIASRGGDCAAASTKPIAGCRATVRLAPLLMALALEIRQA